MCGTTIRAHKCEWGPSVLYFPLFLYFLLFRVVLKEGLDMVCVGLDQEECSSQDKRSSLLPGLRIKNGIQVRRCFAMLAMCLMLTKRTQTLIYSKRYAHSAWPDKWQGFIVLLCAWFDLFSC